MSTLATLVVKLLAETAEFVKDVGGAAGSLKNFGKDASQLGMDMAPVSAGAGLIAVSAVKMAADFETSMSVLQRTSSATDDEMQSLSSAAVALGADMSLPGTSASDAAEAMLELSKAGVSVNDTLAASRGVLQLSAAGQLSNAAAAEVTAAALNMFGLAGSEASRVADLLAAAANASAADVTDMADSLKMAGSVAAAAGVPIEDMTTALGLMANQGIKGSDAGTSLKTMLMRLMAPTDEAAGLMQNLGIQVFDANGKMLSMPQIVGQFSSSLGGLTQEQRNAALATIFGTDAIRAANIVLMGGTEAWNSMATAVTQEGAAQGLAAAQTVGLNGAIGGLQSTIETTLLTAGQPFLEMLSGLVTWIGNLIGSLGAADPMVLKIGMGILAVLAVIAPLGLAIGLLTTAFTALISPIGLVILAIIAVIAVAALIIANWETIQAKAIEIWGAIVAWFGEVWAGIQTAATTIWTAVSEFFTTTFTAIQTTATTIWTAVSGFFTTTFTAIQTVATTIWTAVSDFFTSIWTAISTATTIVWTVLTAYLTAAWTIISALAQAVFNVIRAIVEMVWGAIQTVTFAVWNAISPYLTAIWTAISTTATTIWTAVSGFFTTIFTAIQTTATTIWTAVSGFFTTIFTAIQTTATTIWTAVSGFFTTIFTAIQTVATTIWTAVSGFLSTTWTAISATATTIWTGIRTGIGDAQRAMETVAHNVWGRVTEFLATAWNGIATTATTIWTGIRTGITTVMGDIWASVKEKLDAIHTKFEEIKTAVLGIVTTLVSGITGAFAGFSIHIPMPHFNVSWTDIGFGVSVPDVGVSWYGQGGDFMANGPTLIGVGEAGAEHVQITPWRQMGKDDGEGKNITINLNNPVVREDADIDRLVQRISDALAGRANVNARMNYGWSGS